MPDDDSPPLVPDFDPKRPYRPTLKDQIEGLHARLEAGELSQEEFETARRKLLGEWEGREFEERED